MGFEISNYVGRTVAQRLLLLLIVFHIIASIVMQEVMWSWWYGGGEGTPGLSTVVSSHGIILNCLASLLWIVYNIDALRSRNMLQIHFNLLSIGYGLFNFVVRIVNVISNPYYDSKVRIFAVVTGVELVVVVVAYYFLARRVEKQIGWDIYKIVGANAKTQAMWKLFQSYMVLTKVTCINLVQFYLVSLYDGQLWWYDVGGVILALVIVVGVVVCMPMSMRACKTESGWRMNLILLFYSLVAVVIMADSWYFDQNHASSILFVVWLCVTLFFGIRVRLNFGKGLIQYYEKSIIPLHYAGTIRKRNLNLEEDDHEPDEKASSHLHDMK